MNAQSAMAVVVKNKTVTVMQSGMELRFGWRPGSRLLMQIYSSVEQDVVPIETAHSGEPLGSSPTMWREESGGSYSANR